MYNCPYHLKPNVNCKIRVYNTLGQLLLTIDNITTGQVKIERTNLNSGLYFFQLQRDRQIIVMGKFMIE